MAGQSKGNMTVADAGRKGGETVKRKYGHEFYEEIGRKGGEIGGPKGGNRVRELIKKGRQAATNER
ncbi:MAG: Em GEA1 (EM1) [Chloroflexota bacterium]